MVFELLWAQILIDTAQKRQALGEIEARHQEILRLEENIRVRKLGPE